MCLFIIWNKLVYFVYQGEPINLLRFSNAFLIVETEVLFFFYQAVFYIMICNNSPVGKQPLLDDFFLIFHDSLSATPPMILVWRAIWIA